MIIFSEHDHKYTHLETGNTLNGWTSLIKKFTSPFDAQNQAICSAYKLWLGSEKYNDIVKSRFKRLFSLDPYEVSSYLQSSIVGLPTHLVDELLYEWNYAGILGSDFHLKLENLSYSRGYEINPFTDEKYETIKLPKEHDNQLAHDHLINLEDGYYPELLVCDYSMKQSNTVVTMIDKCFIKTDEHGRRIADIDDIKSNKSRPYASKDKKMEGPLSDLYDNTEEKYKLQVCFGAKLMQTHGFTPRYCAFTHFLEYDENKSKIYLAKYDEELMNKFQKAWKKINKK